MTSIAHLTIETDNGSGREFYTDALALGELVQVQPTAEPSSGFRGFTLGLVTAQPDDVDALMSDALAAGATELKPAAKSLWGYGGVVQAPDGTIVTLASESKKNTGPVTREVSSVVLQLGVADVVGSRRFYEGKGFTVAKSYGRKYAELDTGRISLTLNRRRDLAKNAGVAEDGAGSHRIRIAGSSAFTDPDGYAWVAAD
ncbi:glyoxalase [Salinibacterium sp. GXW1014]|uniref:glyoxalase n=1 Tax=Salinibacterium sp. GXW1014 TaxID=3377838 RepID=UPI00383A721C